MQAAVTCQVSAQHAKTCKTESRFAVEWSHYADKNKTELRHVQQFW